MLHHKYPVNMAREAKMELSEETKKQIQKSEEDIKQGRTHKWEDVKKELDINV